MTKQKTIDQIYELIQECKDLDMEGKAQKEMLGNYKAKDLEMIKEVFKTIKKRELEKKTEVIEDTEISTTSEKKIVKSEIIGTRISAKSEEEFKEFCDSLTKKFMGVMRLYGKLGGKTYTVGLLLEKGRVISATFEDVGKQVVLGDAAILQIARKLTGTKGNLEVFAFTKTDMKRAKKRNEIAALKKPVDFSALGMNIRSNIETWVKESNIETWTKEISTEEISMGKIPKIKRLKTKGPINLLLFARKLSEMDEQRASKANLDWEDKRRLMRSKELRKTAPVSKRDGNVSVTDREQVDETEETAEYVSTTRVTKIETSIGKLHMLVNKHKSLRIDDNLATKLNVSKFKLERWADILHRNNIVDLHYPIIGEPIIRRRGDSGYLTSK
jgi:hypothetical protein